MLINQFGSERRMQMALGVDKLDEIAKRTAIVLDAYKKAYLDLFDRRRAVYESAIEAIKNHPDWAPLEASKPEAAASLMTPLSGRLGTQEDRNAESSRQRRH